MEDLKSIMNEARDKDIEEARENPRNAQPIIDEKW